MNNKIKFLVSLLVLFGLIIACSGNKSDKDKQTKQAPYKDTTKINKDQYRMDETFSGNKNQIIDLIKGPATFVIAYYGTGHFKATIMYADGRVVDVLADVDGQYKAKKKIEIPETTAFILDVQTTGEWSVWRE